MSSIKVSELRPTMDYLLCVLEAHGLAEPSIKDYRSTFGAFERYVKQRKVDMVSESICLDFIESKTEHAWQIFMEIHPMLLYQEG